MGEVLDTGIHPDCAPHLPLNVSILPPAALILLNADSGVPMKETPRTRESGRPSAYTLYVSIGTTLKDDTLLVLLLVVVHPLLTVRM